MPTARVLVPIDSEEDRFLPEGPRCISLLGRPALAWVNIQTAVDATRGTVHVRFWDSGERRRLAMPARPGFLFPTDVANTVLIGLEKAVGTLNLATGVWTPLAKIPDMNPRTIINDGEILPGGEAILFGTKDLQFAEPIAELYHMQIRTQSITRLAGEQTCSNGKVLKRFDEAFVLYDIDTPKKVVTRSRFHPKSRQLTDTATAIDLTGEVAFPDGMVDAGDGTVIIAFYNPHRGGDGVARQYSLETGAAIEEWTIPGSPRVTCPLLRSQDDQVRLILTTATEGMPAEMRAISPGAGCLFIADTGIRSIPAEEFVRL